MTKSELRKLRKQAHAEGRPIPPEAALPNDRGNDPIEFSESRRGYRARERWARRYDELNGAPEGEWDR